MVDPTPAFEWLTDRWRGYYRQNPIPLPERFGRREFGFMFYGEKFFLRHTGFRRRQDVHKFFVGRAPAHAYYSTAFYKEPAAARMVDKGWLGAELIFDLDADHVPGSANLPYDEQLARVKKHFVRLVDEFLRQDFGFVEDQIALTFSGGRGYHAHVVGTDVFGLSARERREIVDYVTGNRLNTEKIIQPQTIVVSGRARKSVTLSPASSPGWPGRVTKALVNYLAELKLMNAGDVVTKLQEIRGIGEKRAKLAAKRISRWDLTRLEAGYVDFGQEIRTIAPTLVEELGIPLAKGETDEPVTADTKRLIRLPGSLHGKTGLKVVTLTRDELDAFDPLQDAVAFGEEAVAVRVTRPLKFSLLGEDYDLSPESALRLPEAAAAFAMARGCALPADA